MKASKRKARGLKSREHILAKRDVPIVQTALYHSPVAMPTVSVENNNPLLGKVLKNAGDDFKFPGNRERKGEKK